MPAVDGFGDPQVSWIVECDGERIIHAGDTLFHGFWWRLARRFGPFDFLQPPREQEAVMTPEEAAKAVRMLGARTVTPIHYGALHQPPLYVETADPVGRLRDAGAALGIQIREPGPWFDLG